MVSRYYAVKTLLISKINELPITVSQIERIIADKKFKIIYYDIDHDEHIRILEKIGVYSLAKQAKAFTYVGKYGNMVFVRSYLSNNDKRLLLAHELGHIILGHTSDNCVLGYSPCGIIDDGQEDEANDFALEFLAPVCVLDRKHLTDASAVSAITLLDRKRSHAVADEIKNHKKFTEHELNLCDQFEIFKLPKRSVKKEIIIGALCFVILASSVIPIYHLLSYRTQTQQQYINNTQNVFVTKAGDKYHDKNCKHIINKDNLIHMSISEAEAAGYEPCSDCKPNEK